MLISRKKGGFSLGNMISNTVYNHYLTAYAPKNITRFDTHKKSELESVYKSILKINKESPWYLDVTQKETQEYAVNIKENARLLYNTIASMGGLEPERTLKKNTAYSSNPDAVDVAFIGDAADSASAPTLNLQVKSLAASQENRGSYLPNEPVSLSAGTYAFEISTGGMNYEFQFSISENESNKDVQKRLAKLINHTNIGVRARLDEGEARSALILSSAQTGLPEGRDELFRVSEGNSDALSGAVSYFGLQYTTRQASNASFLLNGEERTTASNSFTIGKMFDVELKGLTAPDETVTVGLKTDVDSITDNINSLIGSYNTFISAAGNYTEHFGGTNRLVREMGAIALRYQDSLQKIGISAQSDKTMSIDEDRLKEAIASEEAEDAGEDVSSYQTLSGFAESLLKKTTQVSINPMEYVDRTIVAYKNPGHNFINPYMTSAYSGMIFNSYC